MEEAPLSLLDLQPEIWLRIFHKLPLRYALRCKLVCKEWHSLLSDRFFISNYKPSPPPHHPPMNLMLISRRDPNLHGFTFKINGSAPLVGDPEYLHVDFLDEGCITVLGSWNGLVALCNRYGDFCLLNPYTYEEKLVSVADDITNKFFSCFDLYGLSHDLARDEYKAVMVRPHKFFIVSFKDGNCNSKTQHELLGDLKRVEGISSNSTIVKGVPHWICRVNASNADSVIYFDHVVEEFRRVQLPKVRAGGNSMFGLGALDGQLTLALRDLTVGALEVWALEEHEKESSWSMLFVLVDYSCFVTILAWVSDYEVLIDANDGCLTAYNVMNHSVRQLLDKRKGMLSLMRRPQTVICIPSLV